MACIPADPDISGIGVRVAIYAQNLLSFIPVIGVLRDKEVSIPELQAVEIQSTTILITAFAILTSAMVETRTIGLSPFHATIILDLSWMNNTNTFIYFLLYVHHRTQEGPAHIKLQWSAWVDHIKREASGFLLRGPTNKGNLTPLRSGTMQTPDIRKSPVFSIFRRIVLILGSLHLSMMAALGLWFWHNPRRFSSSYCELAETTIIGKSIPLPSATLRLASLVIYALFLLPGLNLLFPAVLFLTIFIVHRPWRRDQHDLPDLPPSPPSILPTLIGMALLCAVNIIFLVDVELALAQNRHLQTVGESTWSFGQILALLLLVLPVRDIWNATGARGNTESLREALQRDAPTEQIL
ncbi:hypothetical protein C8R46DRAFT_945552, partial [Mycena filopes]